MRGVEEDTSVSQIVKRCGEWVRSVAPTVGRIVQLHSETGGVTHTASVTRRGEQTCQLDMSPGLRIGTDLATRLARHAGIRLHCLDITTGVTDADTTRYLLTMRSDPCVPRLPLETFATPHALPVTVATAIPPTALTSESPSHLLKRAACDLHAACSGLEATCFSDTVTVTPPETGSTLFRATGFRLHKLSALSCLKELVPRIREAYFEGDTLMCEISAPEGGAETDIGTVGGAIRGIGNIGNRIKKRLSRAWFSRGR